ncbi:hypothetical protein ElyMa_001139700 [Elysia marginata]|uniref:Uncharacterized protein n=1 Tax=Elysia marginata TaxID=1093978 RepID=A0AAV4HZ49_9GAST|nr:hypothetical protein ElyMa_001139700 [Elysia marginata]
MTRNPYGTHRTGSGPESFKKKNIGTLPCKSKKPDHRTGAGPESSVRVTRHVKPALTKQRQLSVSMPKEQQQKQKPTANKPIVLENNEDGCYNADDEFDGVCSFCCTRPGCNEFVPVFKKDAATINFRRASGSARTSTTDPKAAASTPCPVHGGAVVGGVNNFPSNININIQLQFGPNAGNGGQQQQQQQQQPTCTCQNNNNNNQQSQVTSKPTSQTPVTVQQVRSNFITICLKQ